MRLAFELTTGEQTTAVIPSWGLMLWFLGKTSAGPGPYQQAFLTAVVGYCERTWNITPEVDIPDIPNITIADHKEAITWMNSGHPGVVGYENACLDILVWLRHHGDIARLRWEGFENLQIPEGNLDPKTR